MEGAGLFSAPPALSVEGDTGVVRFTPAPHSSGTATVTVVLEDSGGTFPVRSAPGAGWVRAFPTARAPSGDTLAHSADPRVVEPDHWKDAILTNEAEEGAVTIVGADRSPRQSFTITILPRNDAPAFELAATVTAVADAGPQRFPGAAGAVTAGPDEAAQALSFSLVDVVNAGSFYSIAAFFTEKPTLDANGTLAFTTAPRVHGRVRATFRLRDSGGTAHPGEVDAVTRVVEIVVRPVNRAPSFALLAPRVTAPASPLAGAVGAAAQVAANASRGAPDEEAVQAISFEVLNVSDPALFAPGGQPAVGADGVLTFAGAPGATGVAALTLALRDDGGTLAGGADTSAPAVLEIALVAVNAPPVFALSRTEVLVAQDSGASELPGIAAGVSPGAPGEEAQRLFFNCTVVVGDPALFARLPRLDAAGTLSFALAPGQHGAARVAVVLADDGGTALGGEDTAPGGPQYLTVRALPRPAPAHVVPALAQASGGERVTVRGRAFGPRAGAAALACAPADGAPPEPETCADAWRVEVLVGARTCANVTLLSDEAVACDLPPGRGLLDVTLRVAEAGVMREGVLQGALYQHSLAFGGLTTGGEGFLSPALLPHERADATGVPGDAHLPAALRALADRGVRALARFRGRLYVGGQFSAAGVGGHARADAATRHVAAVDGASAAALGLGLDGAVNALVAFRGRLVAGGAFTRALQPDTAWGSVALVHTGGLAAWDGASWAPLGAGSETTLPGVVMALAVNASGQSGRAEGAEGEGGVLYVGGRFDDRGARRGNVAAWDGAGWRSLCGAGGACGVAGGEVQAIAVHAASLFVAGSFASAGGAPARRVAQFDGRAWYALGALDGDVHALAVLGGQLFAGGAFSAEGPGRRELRRVAVWDAEGWAPVGGGLDGTVHALQAAGECLIAAGAFAEAGGGAAGDAVPARGAARFCVDRSSRVRAAWAPVPFPDAPPSAEQGRGADVAVVRAIALADTHIA